MTGLARDRLASELVPVVLAPPTRARRQRTAPVAMEVGAPRLFDQAGSMPAPSMRGLEVTIAIASLASAILLGLLR